LGAVILLDIGPNAAVETTSLGGLGEFGCSRRVAAVYFIRGTGSGPEGSSLILNYCRSRGCGVEKVFGAPNY